MAEHGRHKVDEVVDKAVDKPTVTKVPVMPPINRIRNSIANIEQAALDIDGSDALADVLSKLAMFAVAVDVLEAELAKPTPDEPTDDFKDAIQADVSEAAKSMER